jgi:hypothetical protein
MTVKETMSKDSVTFTIVDVEQYPSLPAEKTGVSRPYRFRDDTEVEVRLKPGVGHPAIEVLLRGFAVGEAVFEFEDCISLEDLFSGVHVDLYRVLGRDTPEEETPEVYASYAFFAAFGVITVVIGPKFDWDEAEIPAGKARIDLIYMKSMFKTSVIVDAKDLLPFIVKDDEA